MLNGNIKKKELVIIAGSCYPINSATGGLALKCAEYLYDYFNIRLIAIQEDDYYCFDKEYQNIRLYTVTNWRLKWAQRTERSLRSKRGIAYSVTKLSNILARAIGRLQCLFFVIDNNYWFTKKAYKLLLYMNNIKRIDVVLSFNMPIEAHFAAEKFKKHNSIKWVSYWADLFANTPNKLNLFISFSKMTKIQNRLLRKSDSILCTQEILGSLSTENNAMKIISIPYVMKESVLKEDIHSNKSEKETIDFVYMGAFYKDIRNPKKMLDFFIKLPENYHFHIYSTGNCDSIINKYVKSYPKKIIKHKQLPTNELFEIIKKVDVLVNIENSIANASPSKLIELISYRKPIINFSYSNNCGPLLTKYPLFVNVNMNNMNESFNEIEKMLKHKRTITSNEIRELYSGHCEIEAKKLIIKAII